MTIDDINSLIKYIRNMESDIRNIQKNIDIAKEKLKNELENRGEESIDTGIFRVTYKSILTSRFDSSTFKKDNIDLYNKYLKESLSMRLNIY